MPDQIMETSRVSSSSTPRSLKPAKACACGKAILVGEHAVVYGARAVAMPLRELRMQVELHPGHYKADQEPQFSLKLGDKEMSPRIGGVITEAMALLGIQPRSIAIQGRSSIPFGAGLGSSATLCVVVLRSVAQAAGRTLLPAQLADFANQLEKRFHGTPSGLDTAVVAHEESILFRKGGTIESLSLDAVTAKKPAWHFALIDSNVRSSTLAMIHLAAPFFQGAAGETRVGRFDRLAVAAAQELQSRNVGAMKEIIHEAGHLLWESGVVTPTLHEMMERCSEYGILASKTTGAGGGGTILALLDPTQPQAQLASLREAFGADKVFSVSL